VVATKGAIFLVRLALKRAVLSVWMHNLLTEQLMAQPSACAAYIVPQMSNQKSLTHYESW